MLKNLNATACKPARVLVLGGGGFIGRASLEKLRAAGIDAAALGRPGIDLLAPDAAARLEDALRPDDVLVFVAAKAPCKTVAMLRENLVMAEAVCAALRARPVAHVIYISSDAVYRDSREPLSESSCAQPASLHGVMHLAREIALRNDYRGPLAVVRPTLVYGLDDPHNGYGPNRFRRLAADGADIVLFGEGEERRDHVDVDDVAELVRLIVLHRSTGIANAVSGEVVSFRALADFAVADFGRGRVTTSARSGPMPHDGYRPFQRSSAEAAFPGFRFRPWRDGLSRVHALQKSR